MAVVVVLLCLGFKFGIDLYTHHGQEVRIPDIRHKSFADAAHLLDQRSLGIVVTDTGYVRTLPPDCILEQFPEPGRKVKPGRVIKVIINSDHSPMLTLPDVIDNNSYREAKARLMAMGFKVGQPEYVPGERDWVYGIKCRGVNLQSGQKVSVEDMLIIQVGDGMRDMNDSVMYTDPDYYYESSDSSETSYPTGPASDVMPDGEEDEFEVVTGP